VLNVDDYLHVSNVRSAGQRRPRETP
jgi:hypothetical protein